MISISHKIAFRIIIACLFVAMAFTAFYYQKLDYNLYPFLLILFVFIVSFAFAVSINIITPVKTLLKKAEKLSSGEFAGRFFIQNKDELGQLAKVFNKIAQNVGQAKYDSKKLQEAFDRKVEEIVGLMGETIDNSERKVKNREIEFQKFMKDFEILKEQLRLRDMKVIDLQKKIDRIKIVKNKIKPKKKTVKKKK